MDSQKAPRSESDALPPTATFGLAEPLVERVRYEAAFEFSPDPQLLTDNYGLIEKANYAAAALLRCPKEFLVAKPLGLFVAQGYRSRFYDSLARLRHGAASDVFETRVVRRGEEPRVVVVRASAEAGQIPFRWLVRDVTDWRRAEADRVELLRKLVTVQEDERRRLARDLHDGVAQLLTALRFGLESVEESVPLPPEGAAALGLVRRLANELSRAVRDLAHDLRPVALDELGLYAALEQLLAAWSARQPGLEIDFQADAVEVERLHPDLETAIYRVIQEALTNVFRHAQARRVRVAVQWHDGMVLATVTDDGIGFDPKAVAGAADGTRLGLVGMRERAALAGGRLEIASKPGGGTRVTARFPGPPGAEAGAEQVQALRGDGAGGSP